MSWVSTSVSTAVGVVDVLLLPVVVVVDPVSTGVVVVLVLVVVVPVGIPVSVVVLVVELELILEVGRIGDVVVVKEDCALAGRLSAAIRHSQIRDGFIGKPSNNLCG